MPLSARMIITKSLIPVPFSNHAVCIKILSKHRDGWLENRSLKHGKRSSLFKKPLGSRLN